MTYKFMTCSECRGYGLVTNTYTGEPDDCPKCGQSGQEVARDNKGRFVKGLEQHGESPSAATIKEFLG